MQDFYILQRTATKLDAGEIRRWYLTVDMLAPDNIIMGDDETNSFMLASQDKELLYIVPLVRHLTEEEAERIKRIAGLSTWRKNKMIEELREKLFNK